MRRWAARARANLHTYDYFRLRVCVSCHTDRDLCGCPHASAGPCACANRSLRGCVGCHADRALCAWADAHPDLRARPDACPCAYSNARCGVPAYLNTSAVSHTNSRLHADLDT